MNRVVSKTTLEYYNEFLKFISDFRFKDKDERLLLCEEHSKRLFLKSEKVVNLEGLFMNRCDYQKKFARAFLLITDTMMSPLHLGKTCQVYFQELTQLSRVYPKQVILAYSLMGYIKGIKCDCQWDGRGKGDDEYKDVGTGYVYALDMSKVKPWDSSFGVSVEVPDADKWDTCLAYWNKRCPGWLIEKQVATLERLDISENWYKDARELLSMVKDMDNIENEKAKRGIECADQIIQFYHNGWDWKFNKYKDIVCDFYGGRCYTPIVRMCNEVRTKCLTLNGEPLCELDLAAAQPTLLGMKFLEGKTERQMNWYKTRYQWIYWSLKGKFYEWVACVVYRGIVTVTEKDINSITKEERNQVKEHMMHFLYSTTRMDANRKPSPCACAKVDKDWICMEQNKIKQSVTEWSREKGITDQSYIKKQLDLRMENLYERVKNRERKYFCQRLSDYLYRTEKKLYSFLDEYKKKENLKTKTKFVQNKDGSYKEVVVKNKIGKVVMRTDVSKELQGLEVRYIKECLKRLPDTIENILTIHDCIMVAPKDKDIVKSVMREVAIEMFGVPLIVK